MWGKGKMLKYAQNTAFNSGSHACFVPSQNVHVVEDTCTVFHCKNYDKRLKENIICLALFSFYYFLPHLATL